MISINKEQEFTRDLVHRLSEVIENFCSYAKVLDHTDQHTRLIVNGTLTMAASVVASFFSAIEKVAKQQNKPMVDRNEFVGEICEEFKKDILIRLDCCEEKSNGQN